MADIPTQNAQLGNYFRRRHAFGQTQFLELRAKDILGFRFRADSAGHAKFIAFLKEIVF